MTCEELRLYVHDALRLDGEFRVDPEHLVHCAVCAQFVEAQRKLGAGLRLMRQSVPQVPASLDAVVLADYRRHVRDYESVARSTPWRRRFIILSWSAAATALVVVAALVFFSERRAVIPGVRTHAQDLSAGSRAVTANKTAVHPQLPNARTSHPARRERQAPVIAAMESPASAGFRSLMYCDELSCGGAMEVIRLQLPSSAAALAPAGGSTNGPVLADVLVGADGIVRGIRIVE